ncbi:GPW/gp25 family protein [Rhizobium halophytocola]|uniref:Phage baseplate assembly protein W n=1 Tax=Rhizobium halophytocola TaxID=735519 RepID=A0ABS4E2D8_9HYPH|nr:GPW/gp25 family protein [Rhizobium halophytocola]MBP1852119.1 phage baseplate assembly protein W [Rhizobium halophytocola]
MTGIDRRTGRSIDNLTSAYQGVEVILTTRLSSRVMRREFGAGVVELLGRAVTPSLFTSWMQLVATAIDIWEPRLAVRRIVPSGTVDQIRLGQVGILIEADYRPRGHLGDFTVERVVGFTIGLGRGVTVSGT